MKKALVLLLAFLWAATAFAQYVPEWHQGDLKRRGAKIAILDEKLDKETTLALIDQVGGPEMVASWEKYARERGWGIGLTAGGFTLATVGFCFGGVYLIGGVFASMFASIGGQEAVDGVWADLGPLVQAGAIGCAAGLAAGTTGIVLLCVGNGNLKKIVRTCDAAGLPPVEIVLGPAPSGVGLTLRF